MLFNFFCEKVSLNSMKTAPEYKQKSASRPETSLFFSDGKKIIIKLKKSNNK